MLHQMIDSISGKDKDENELLTMKKLCATRRSAGLPFMIQALITSELKVSTNKNFHFVMKNLMEFCQQGTHLETRTHSMNILRALFRCSDLNDAIGEYIADGFKCAILGYGAESWIERNSSTLLFASLMVRIFGVQRTKDSEELNIRNKMTGRIFFLRYPELYDFFMEQLEEAADFVKNVKMNAKLHPLLLLLIRLYPSAIEGSESNLKLTNFIPVVAMCSGCVEMQTRVLCARFISSVSPPDTMTMRILETIKVFDDSDENLPANAAHGILLQILYQVKTLPTAQPDEVRVEENLLDILDDILPIGKRFKKQLICYGTYLDIMWEIYERLWPVHYEHAGKLSSCIDETMLFDSSALFGLPLLTKKVYQLMLMSSYLKEPSLANSFPQECLLNIPETTNLTSSEPEISFRGKKTTRQFANFLLNTMLACLKLDYAVNMQDEYEISDQEMFVLKQMTRLKRATFVMDMQSNEQQKLMLTQLLASKDYNLMVKTFDVMSMIAYQEGNMTSQDLQDMIETAMNEPEHMKKSLLKFANHVMKHEEFFLKIDFDFLVEISTDSSFFIK